MNILLTGGASGLGLAILEKLVSDSGNFVWFTYSNSAEHARALEARYANCRALHCDFLSHEDIARVKNEMEKMDLHLLINNAMPGFEINHFHKLPAGYFGRSFASGVEPVLELTRQAILLFRKAKNGRIITVLTAYLSGDPPIGLSEYVAAKSYLLSMSRSWAVENARYNIASNCISPSFMLTPMNRNVDERVIEQMIESSPAKKLLTPQEVAEQVEKLAHASLEISGTNQVINAS